MTKRVTPMEETVRTQQLELSGCVIKITQRPYDGNDDSIGIWFDEMGAGEAVYISPRQAVILGMLLQDLGSER